MATDNVITITGNLADDPELRFTPSGAAVAKGVLFATLQRSHGLATVDRWREERQEPKPSPASGFRIHATNIP